MTSWLPENSLIDLRRDLCLASIDVITNLKNPTVKRLLIALSIVLSGCNSTSHTPARPQPSASEKAEEQAPTLSISAIEQMYLRGSFSLWNYQSQYQLQRVGNRRYSAAAELSEGKVYEFMFSGKDASKANCGYQDKTKDQWLKVGKTSSARCQGVVLQNFIFKPVVSGVYEFFLDFTNAKKPTVYVKKAY